MVSHIFPRHTHDELPIASGGYGCFLFDETGKKYLDASGGAAVSCLGHSHPKIIKALHEQLDVLAYAHTSFFSSEPAEKLATKLITNAPGDLSHVYLVSGGSEAIEAALKLARQYFLENGQPGRKEVIARRQSYHGNTLGALAVGGNEWRRSQFAPLLIDTHHIAPCYAYREKLDHETDYEFGQRVAGELEITIEGTLRYTLRKDVDSNYFVYFEISELVRDYLDITFDGTYPTVPAVDGYFKTIQEICDHHGILLILDEVMCGMGRTGTLFAYEQEAIAPDIVCIAKGLGAGYQPIGATICTDKIYAAIKNGSGFFQHGHTYLGHPMAAAAANAVLDVLLDDNILENVNVMGYQFKHALDTKFGQHTHVGDIRGRGLFYGLELVEERETKEPFSSSYYIARKIKAIAKKRGLLCYPMSGTVDGKIGDHILLAPPYIINEAEINELIGLLADSLEEALQSPEETL